MNPESGKDEAWEADLAERVERVVRGEGDVRDEVGRLSREALARGRLDLERARAVAGAVGRGASAGAGEHPERARAAVADAVAGLQDSLAHGAESARLAAQETTGRLGDYSRDQLRRTADDIRTLEPLMLDSLQQSADAARDTGSAILSDLVRHGRREGTRLGTELDASLRKLASGLPEAMRETVLAGIGAATETGARAAEAAGGMLEGVADALRTGGKRADAPREDPGTDEPR